MKDIKREATLENFKAGMESIIEELRRAGDEAAARRQADCYRNLMRLHNHRPPAKEKGLAAVMQGCRERFLEHWADGMFLPERLAAADAASEAWRRDAEYNRLLDSAPPTTFPQ